MSHQQSNRDEDPGPATPVRARRFDPTEPIPPLPPHAIGVELYAWLAQVARLLLRSVQHLTRTEKQFLRDLQREDVRYPMTGLVYLLRLCARSSLGHHRDAVPQVLRGIILAQQAHTGDELLSIAEAFARETDAQSAFDKAQITYALAPTAKNRQLAVFAGLDQVSRTQATVNSLIAQVPTQ